MLEALILGMAALALLGIILEEVIHLNKAKTTLFLGCLSWMALFIHAKTINNLASIHVMLDENLLEIANLWLFLMASMTFVAYLNARGLVSELVQRIMPGQLHVRHLIILLSVFSLVLSMVCDNITATLVGIGVVQAFELNTKEKIKLSVLTVFAVNSGGVMLITGDVTTLMIFSEGYVTITNLLRLFLPSIVGVALLAICMGIGKNRKVTATNRVHEIQWLDLAIAAIFVCTIVSTMALNLMFGVPPVLTFLTGLSVMFLIGSAVHTHSEQIGILEYVRQIQFDTLLFFLGILLLVGALKEIGVLVWFADAFMSVDPLWSSYGTGVLSSLLDNVPLTAALLKAHPELSQNQWLALTYAVGVGGSLLVIGSAAGIVAMSRIKELTFVQYARYLPFLLLAYSAGYFCSLVV